MMAKTKPDWIRVGDRRGAARGMGELIVQQHHENLLVLRYQRRRAI